MAYTIRTRLQNGKKIHLKLNRRWMTQLIQRQQAVINQFAEEYTKQKHIIELQAQALQRLAPKADQSLLGLPPLPARLVEPVTVMPQELTS